MSSTTAGATVERQTYWCHECDMSVSVLSATVTATSLLCPYCHSDFLEEMNSSLRSPNSNPSPNFNLSPFSSFLDLFPSPPQTLVLPTTTTDIDVAEINEASNFQFPSATADDDNFLLDSPYLHRLIQHLTNSESDGSSPSATTLHHSPALKSAVQALPTVKISHEFLERDPISFCAVCKDQFVIDVEAKQLPCKHIYHSDCILPWLSQRNSCPVCRFQLPTERDDSRGRRRRFVNVLYTDDDDEEEEEEELLGFGSPLRRLMFPVMGRSRGDESWSPTQIAEAEMGFPGRSNSMETVSSWPSWPVEGGVGVGGTGDGEISMSARVNEEADIVFS